MRNVIGVRLRCICGTRAPKIQTYINNLNCLQRRWQRTAADGGDVGSDSDCVAHLQSSCSPFPPPRRSSPLCCNSCCLFGLPRTPQRSRKSVPVPENLPRSRRILENCVKLTTQFSNRMPGVAVGSPKNKNGQKEEATSCRERERKRQSHRERGELARERKRSKGGSKGETDKRHAERLTERA